MRQHQGFKFDGKEYSCVSISGLVTKCVGDGNDFRIYLKLENGNEERVTANKFCVYPYPEASQKVSLIGVVTEMYESKPEELANLIVENENKSNELGKAILGYFDDKQKKPSVCWLVLVNHSQGKSDYLDEQMFFLLFGVGVLIFVSKFEYVGGIAGLLGALIFGLWWFTFAGFLSGVAHIGVGVLGCIIIWAILRFGIPYILLFTVGRSFKEQAFRPIRQHFKMLSEQLQSEQI